MSATRSPLKAAINARSSLQEDARKREALAVPGSKAKSMWKMALDHVTHPFVEEDLKVLASSVKKLGNPGPIEDTHVVDLAKIIDDEDFDLHLKNLVKTLKAGRKRGILTFEGTITLLPGGASAAEAPVANPNGPYPVHIEDHETEAATLAKERLERAKSVALVVQLQEEERERQLREVDAAEGHSVLARQATIEEAKEALEEERRRRVDELHPHDKPVQRMVRQHTKSKVNMQMEVERERRMKEKEVSAVTPPKINLGNVPVIN